MSQNVPFAELQQAVYTALTTPAITDGSSTLAVYSPQAPNGSAVPYIVIGEDFVNGSPSTKSHYLTEHLCRLHLYDAGTSMAKAKRLAKTVAARLVNASLSIAGYTVLGFSFDACHAFLDVEDPAGKQYTHAVIDLRTIIQQS